MFRNHLKIALRNLLKNKYTTFINLAGLVVGMTSAMLIWQYVAFERSYDKFNEKADRIVRVRTDRYPQGRLNMQFAAGAACAGPLLKENFSEVEEFVKVYPIGERIITNEDITFREKKVAFASAPFFSVFTYPMVHGDPATCLAEPWTACVSKSIAKKYFGEEDPMGKSFKINANGGQDSYKITGVFEDMPENAHAKWDILLSYITFTTVKVPGGQAETEAFWDGFMTYLLLKPGVNQKALEQKIPALISDKFGTPMRQYSDSVAFAFQPLTSIHLNSNYLFEAEPNGDESSVRFLLIIGSLVLLIAWFNYINLSTARSETRAKEVGVRKVVGSGRGSLILQFMTEAGLLNLVAIGISIGMAQLVMPLFERLAGKPLPFTLFAQSSLWLTIFGVLLFGTLLAGLYPAFVLSSFKPSIILKGGNPFSHMGRNFPLRKILVVGQFIASVALIAGTIIVFRQLSHMRAAKLGVDIDKTLVINAPSIRDSTYREKYNTLKKELLQISDIKSITGSTVVPGEPFGWTAGGIRRWGAPESESEGVQAMAADFDFVSAYNMELAAGRNFSKDMVSDSAACLLNELAVEQLHLGTPKEAVGVDINFWGDKLTIVGVLKNFHQESPKLAYEPLVMRVLDQNNSASYFSVKVNTAHLNQTLSTMEKKWSAFFPGNPFDYFFLDQHFEEQYAADRRFGRVFGMFAMLAIFVSCLGLFALAAFVAQRRTKEIGIRKVLGASVENLVGLLSKEFLWLVAIAIVIATPLTFYFMNKWLEDFAYRIDIHWWVFALAGILALLIAFVTVSFQSIKAALANPVKSLRSE